MGFPQSSRAYADMRRPEQWGFCDRCNFRHMLDDLRWQWDFRGNALSNLRILVCRPCEDRPFELNRPVVVGPDGVPPRDPRPGFITQEEGVTPAARTPLQILTEAIE
jgi:hypothetical protein